MENSESRVPRLHSLAQGHRQHCELAKATRLAIASRSVTVLVAVGAQQLPAVVGNRIAMFHHFIALPPLAFTLDSLFLFSSSKRGPVH